ncbi:MAG TPA: winged helix-turn-helix domain-containing protein [Bacillota bacterium]|nr:winged helix-turn-helix domain-containing protein [Bacillota bacterium]
MTHGDADIAHVAAAIGEPARGRMLMALLDGRALPASVLAREAGVAPSTASGHLDRLLAAGLLAVEPSGRHRYYRLAGAEVAAALESLARLAPGAPVRSLRQSTQAEALRHARTCYDHIAGRLGVEIMASLIDRGCLAGGDGRHDPARARRDRYSAPGTDIAYTLTPAGERCLQGFGVELAGQSGVRYCVDWTEQRHHLGGRLGALLMQRLLALDWVRRAPAGRALLITPAGRRGLEETFGARP